ncbi:MAG: hypothetical protein KDC46_13255 [Thermoleophilia bacterium]|nr:hypothetical protein [Thermoleophilia bacterium]
MHRIARTVVASLLTLIAGMLLAGCDSASDKASEKIAEKVIEQSSGDDVDVNVDGDSVSVESKDGSGSFSTSKELPKDWPAELELPDGSAIVASSTIDTGSDDGTQSTVHATIDEDPADVVKHFADQLDGWKETAKSTIDTDGTTIASASWEDGDEKVSVTATTGDSDTTFIVGLSRGA